MKMYVFEGTPEEISEVVRTMQPMTPAFVEAGKASGRPTPISASRSEDGPEKFVTVDFARKTLTRREISDPVKALFRTLYEAGEEFVPSADLYKATDYSVSQFSGLMGAFGRRMANTDGYDEEAHFFDFRWDQEAGAWQYRLPGTVREALEMEGLV